MLMLIAATAMASPQFVTLTPNMRITRSSTIERGVYRFSSAADDGASGAVTIEGDGITVDFNGSTLEGTPQRTEPDMRKGTGIIVKGKNVTIKNVKVRGYRHGLIARNVPNLRIFDSDFSYNWKQRLASTLDREDVSDWMSFHKNENDEWLRFGEGIYLRGCDNFEVKNCTIVGGQSGLMITGSNKGKIWNNNFSYLSALGLGMYRSSDNVVMHNNIDWCVRGFSYGVYNRGQDSAGILVYEQSHRNTFAYNSVTHGGDGFFLWAGQTTMDTGKGGCNDNLLYGNDFSHAPTNGIEATFSRNKFINNLMMECWHGIWGGYSYESEVIGNVFAYNEEAIAWEHGQDNKIIGNRFYRNNEDVVIWANATQDPNWGYPKNRDTASRNWKIEHNGFANTFASVFRISRSRDLVVTDNMFNEVSQEYKLGEAVERFSQEGNDSFDTGNNGASRTTALNTQYVAKEEYLQRFDTNPRENILMGWNPKPDADEPGLGALGIVGKLAPKQFPGGKTPFLKPGTLRGWRYILVDEWGPYDFKSPKLWPRGKTETGALLFEILGPKGKWQATTFRGGKLNKSEGDVPGFVEVTLNPGEATDLYLDFTYTGEEITTPFGEKIAKGKPSRFSYRKFFAPIAWDIKWFAYDKNTQEPRSMRDAFAKLLQTGTPIKTLKTDTLDFAWGGALGEGLPSDHFATVADGTFEVPEGDYVLHVTSDDGVRVYIDGKVVLEDWTWHAPKLDKVDLKLAKGKHTIKVEHFEIDGYATLKVALQPK
jgi:parallel beta-helix repeat protein